MDLSPGGIKELVRSEAGKRLFRYTMVSVISVIVSLVVLGILAGPFHWSPFWANVTACAVATVPSYELNRKWAWGKGGKSHMWKEVVPFWVLAFIGLAFSSAAVGVTNAYAKDHHYSHPKQVFLAEVVSIAAFGILWVGKFLIFNKILFRTHPDDLEPALDGRTGIAL